MSAARRHGPLPTQLRPTRHPIRLSAEAGMTLIEVLFTSLVLVVGLMATLAIFGSSSNTAVTAERRTAMIALAQRELEKVRPLPYASVALSSAPTTQAATEAPRRAPASSEALVTDPAGVVNPGPEAFSLHGVTGRIYRYVTWRKQNCVLARTKVAQRVAATMGIATAEVEARVGDLCLGEQDTKRVTVIVVPDGLSNRPNHTSAPIQLASLMVDPSGSSVLDTDGKSLALQPTSAEASGTITTQTFTEQTLRLFDTPCSSTTRIPPSASHATRDTSVKGAVCSGSAKPDLMGTDAIGGAVSDTLYDYSNDLARTVGGGLSMRRDDRQAACGTSFAYESVDASRRSRSVHSWASNATTSPASIAPLNPRGALTLWTSTSSGAATMGRLCVTVWRQSDGVVLGSVDYELPAWPGSPQMLSFGIELLPGAVIAAGDRVMLTLRVRQSSGSDISVFYDHPAYPSSLTLAMTPGQELK